LEDLGADGKTILKLIKEAGWEEYTGFIWLRIGTSDGLL
jgi:hypothetical protein